MERLRRVRAGPARAGPQHPGARRRVPVQRARPRVPAPRAVVLARRRVVALERRAARGDRGRRGRLAGAGRAALQRVPAHRRARRARGAGGRGPAQLLATGERHAPGRRVRARDPARRARRRRGAERGALRQRGLGRRSDLEGLGTHGGALGTRCRPDPPDHRRRREARLLVDRAHAPPAHVQRLARRGARGARGSPVRARVPRRGARGRGRSCERTRARPLGCARPLGAALRAAAGERPAPTPRGERGGPERHRALQRGLQRQRGVGREAQHRRERRPLEHRDRAVAPRPRAAGVRARVGRGALRERPLGSLALRSPARTRPRAGPPAPGRHVALTLLQPLRLSRRGADELGLDVCRCVPAIACALRRDAVPERREATMSRCLASLLLALLVFFARPAHAQVARTFTPRFNTQTTGDVTLIGNTLMTCSGGVQCAGAQGGGNGNVNNQNFTMQYVDVDADPSTFSSSTATLSLPPGARVLWAGLYWGGSSAAASRNTARLAVPGGGYVTLTAQQLDAIGDAYQGFVDVTSQVRAAGSGTYAVANVVSTPAGSDVWAGWSIVVAYHLDSQLSRNLTVADGFVFTGPGNAVNLTVSGFLTPPTGTVQAGVGFVAWDGDRGHQGEDLILNSSVLSDALNEANNVFNSTVSLEGTRFAAKSPDFVNQLGFDADILAANGVLGNGTTSAPVSLQSARERYHAGATVFKSEIFVTRFDASSYRKTVTDLNGGAVRPGDVLEYTITARNVGTDAALQTVVRDTLATTLTYVAGSLRVSAGANLGPKTDAAGDDAMEYLPAPRVVVARIGAGANGTSGGQLDVGVTTSVVFRAQVAQPAPAGTSVVNQAALACIGAQLGLPQSAVSDGDSLTAGEQPTVVATASSPITGTVFEDVNYGGGAGRSRVASAGAAVAGARVELYDASGDFRGAAGTEAARLYALDGRAAGPFPVRAGDASVAPQRPG